MQIQQAYKYQLNISAQQECLLRQFAGCCRFVYNKALSVQQEAYNLEPKSKFSYAKLANLLPIWKSSEDLAWLKSAPSQALQQALKNLEASFKNFFAKRASYPKFKKRGLHDSFRLPQGCKLDQQNSRIFLPKLGWLRYRNSRKVLGEIKNVTLSLTAGKWFVSIQTAREVADPVHISKTAVGLDLGIARLATLSDGVYFESEHSFKCHKTKLAKLQKSLGRKTKFSSNSKKLKQKISRLHHKIANIRKNSLHQITNTISKNHAIVFVEDLQTKNMSKSAAGNLEKPGRNVKAKSGLNRSILDQGWFEFKRQLEYKLLWRGGQIYTVNPKNTSRTCIECDHISKDNRQTQAKFCCVNCGYTENADLVAAKNILRAGLAQLACGEVVQSGSSMKQEPTEVALQCA
jgi:putative transposase